MNFENLKPQNILFLQGLLKSHNEAVREEAEISESFEKHNIVEEIYKVKPNMFVVQFRSRTNPSEEACFQSVVNKRSIGYVAHSLEAAIIQGFAYEKGDINAALYMNRIIGIE